MMPTRKEIANYYEKEYKILNPTLHLESSRFKASEIFSLLQKMGIDKITNLVDLGCGSGGVSKELSKLIKCQLVVGCDISSSILQITKKVNKNLLLVKADCPEVPIQSKYADVVLLIDTLEHLICPQKTVAEAARISKKWLVIRTPIEDCLFYKLKKTGNTWASQRKFRCGHLWKFNVSLLKNLLEENGFKLVEVQIVKHRLSLRDGISFGNLMIFILTRLIPSVAYRKLFPAEHLILAELYAPSFACARARGLEWGIYAL